VDKDEAMKLALEALESDHPDIQLRAAVVLRQALEQPSDIEAAIKAENEACAKIVDAEIKLIGEKLQSIDERINSAIAIRVRMNDD